MMMNMFFEEIQKQSHLIKYFNKLRQAKDPVKDNNIGRYVSASNW